MRLPRKLISQGTIVAFLMALGVLEGCSAGDNWQTLQAVALQQQDAKQAIVQLKQALSLAESSANENEQRESLRALRDKYEETGDNAEAATAADRIIALTRSSPPNSVSADDLWRASLAHERLGEFDKAKDFGERSVRIFESSSTTDERALAAARLALARAHAGLKNFKDAIQEANKALRIDEADQGKESKYVQEDLRLLARLQTRAESFDDAQASYDRLIALNSKLNNAGNPISQQCLRDYLGMLRAAKKGSSKKFKDVEGLYSREMNATK